MTVYRGIGEYYCTLQFAEYKRPRPFDNFAFKRVGTKYILPIPLQLFDNVGVDYTTTSLETVGDLINFRGSEPVGGAGSVGGAVALRVGGSIVNGGIQGAADMMGGLGRAGRFIGQQAGNLFNAAQMDSAIQSSIGFAPNPNQTVSFNGPRLRELNFSWTFLPQSREESTNVSNFIKELKRRSLPTSQFGINAGVLKYPNMVRMNFFPWDKGGERDHYGWTENSFIRLKRCVIERVAVNYAPSNIPAFFEGTKQPVATQVEITLKELEYMMSEDFTSERRPARGAVDSSINTLFEAFSNPVDFVASGETLPGELSQLTPRFTQPTDTDTAITDTNGGQ